MAFSNNREGKLDHSISFLEKSRPGMDRAIENHEQIKAWAIENHVKILARAIEHVLRNPGLGHPTPCKNPGPGFEKHEKSIPGSLET